MYAWYFPKGFNGLGYPSRRHDWQSVVVWIDNFAVETPKIVGVSLSKSDSKYKKKTEIYANYFAGAAGGYHYTYVYGSSNTLRFEYLIDLVSYIAFADWDGAFQVLIMWEQLTDAARAALNDSNFGEAEVPISDEHYQDHLDNAWPF